MYSVRATRGPAPSTWSWLARMSRRWQESAGADCAGTRYPDWEPGRLLHIGQDVVVELGGTEDRPGLTPEPLVMLSLQVLADCRCLASAMGIRLSSGVVFGEARVIPWPWLPGGHVSRRWHRGSPALPELSAVHAGVRP